MRAMLVRFGGVVLAFAVAFLLADPAGAQSVDLTGTWQLDVQTDAGSGSPTVTLEQDGDELTGHYSSANLGEADVTGTVDGDEFEFSFDASAQGMSVTVTYTGTVDDENTISGSVDLGGQASGSFTGERQEG